MVTTQAISLSKRNKIIVSNNHWANIGDAFYQNSIIHDLKEVYRNQADILHGEEHTCHRDALLKFCNNKVFNYSLFSSGNCYILSGPILHKNFPKLYAPLLKELHKRKVKIVLISVGGLSYSSEEVRLCREVLEAYPPYVLSTRDTPTYKAYGDLAKYSYDGICSAFYSSLQYPGYETPELDNYVVYSFDKYAEPLVSVPSSNNTSELIANLQIKNKSSKRLSRLDNILDYFKKYPDYCGDKKIIRLHHETLTKLTPLIYRRPNTFVSLNPYSYLNIIKNASLTLATRVHACVIALSYQKPAMLFVNTKRSYLFERLGLQEIIYKPVNLEREKLEEEHQNFKDFLQKIELC